MNHYKYWVQTYHQLPQAKFLWDNIWRLPFVLQKMIEDKPPNLPLNDIENSISAVRIDTRLVPNYVDIFLEQKIWHWSTVKIKKPRKKYIHDDGTPKTLEEIREWVDGWKKKFDKCG